MLFLVAAPETHPRLFLPSYVGGIDNYLLQTSDEKLDSDAGLRLRRLLLETLKRDAARARARGATAAGGNGAALEAPAEQVEAPAAQQAPLR